MRNAKKKEMFVLSEESYFAWLHRHHQTEIVGMTCDLYDNSLARYLAQNYHRMFMVWSETTRGKSHGWYCWRESIGNFGESLVLPEWVTVELQRFDCIHGGVQGPVTRRQYDQAISQFRDGSYEQLVAAYKRGELTATQFESNTGRPAVALRRSGEELSPPIDF